MLMTSNHDIALKGAQDYGTKTYASTFDPACDAYRSIPNSKNDRTTFFSASSTDDNAAGIETTFSAIPKQATSPFPLNFFANITNQPTFADGSTCDNMIRLFNTSVTTAPNRIEHVVGTVKAKIHPFKREHVWNDVFGVRMDTAFIENNYLPCEGFRGYGG